MTFLGLMRGTLGMRRGLDLAGKDAQGHPFVGADFKAFFDGLPDVALGFLLGSSVAYPAGNRDALGR